MTTPPDSIGGDLASSPAADRHRFGPWLITYGEGVESEDVASALSAHLTQAHDIAVHVTPIDELDTIRGIARFLSLINIICPEDPAAIRRAAMATSKAVRLYRRHQPYNLQHLLTSQQPWWEVGVVQLVMPGWLLLNPDMRRLQSDACWVHDLSTGTPDLTAPYQDAPLVPVRGPASMAVLATVEPHFKRLSDWGLTADLEQVRAILNQFRRLREAQENNFRASAARRPLHNVEMTLLDFILERRVDEYESNWSKGDKWRLAAVARDVISEMHRLNENFSRPGRGPGAVDQLGRLYHSLSIVEIYLEAMQN